MSHVRPASTVMLSLLGLGLAACGGAPDAPDPANAAAAPPVVEAPPPATSPAMPAEVTSDAPPAASSDAEAPEEVMPAVQLAYALVPPDSKGLSPGEGAGEYRVDLPTVTFEFNSATPTPQGRAQLDELAAALNYDTAAPYRFLVTGHTDTAGPKDVNETLSWARAEAARDYLIQEHGIDPDRLEIDGRGERNLAWPTEDEVPQWRNRRVEVVNLGLAG